MSWSTAARTLVGIDADGARGHRDRRRPRAHSCSPRRRRRTCCTWSTTTAGCSPSRSTTTGASGTTTMPVGSIHLIETLEFFLALREIGWKRADPARPVPVPRGPGRGRAQSSINTMKAIDAAIDRIDLRRAGRHPGAPGRARGAAARHRAAARAGAGRMSSAPTFSATAEEMRAGARRDPPPQRGDRPRRRARPHRRRPVGGGHPGHALLRACSTSTRSTRDDPERDRYIQSKGHASRRALHDARRRRASSPTSWLDTYMADARRSTATPTATRCRAWRPTPARSGTGCRWPSARRSPPSSTARRAARSCSAATASCRRARNWEAIMAAGHRGLDNLTAIVDRNGLQQGARTEAHERARPAGRQVRGLRLGGARRSTATTSTRCWTAFDALPFEPGRPSCVIATHDQGPRRVVHGGPRRVAPQGAQRRADRRRRSRSSRRERATSTAATRSSAR